MAEYSLRGSPPPHPAGLTSSWTKQAPLSTMIVSKQRVSEVPSLNRIFEGPFGEKRNASHPTAASHSAWVSTHQTHTSLDSEHVKTGSIRGGVVKSPSRGPIWRNTQCEPSHRRIPLSLCIHSSNTYQPRRRACHNRESSRCRREIAFSRAHFAKNATRAIPQPHPTQLGSPRTKHISISTAIV